MRDGKKKKVSFIIRTRNEAHNLRVLFPLLRAQTEQDFEIIVVDNESSDDTKTLAESFGARIVSVSYAAFSYPYASNRGCEAAEGEYLVFLSAHSFPLSRSWLAKGLRHFTDSSLCGAYGPTLAYRDSALVEKLFHIQNGIAWTFRAFLKPRRITHGGMGVMGLTNAIIPKRLWDMHRFDEAWGAGGEDGAWAGYFFEKGYAAIWDPALSVRHAHRLTTRAGLKDQFLAWSRMTEPRPFSRKDLAFRPDNNRLS